MMLRNDSCWGMSVLMSRMSRATACSNSLTSVDNFNLVLVSEPSRYSCKNSAFRSKIDEI
jgi:hypothetical protein